MGGPGSISHETVNFVRTGASCKLWIPQVNACEIELTIIFALLSLYTLFHFKCLSGIYAVVLCSFKKIPIIIRSFVVL